MSKRIINGHLTEKQQAIADLLDKQCNGAEIARRLGISPSRAYYLIRKVGDKRKFMCAKAPWQLDFLPALMSTLRDTYGEQIINRNEADVSKWIENNLSVCDFLRLDHAGGVRSKQLDLMLKMLKRNNRTFKSE